MDINVSASRNYWFIRTAGGRYFEEFVKKGFVAIDWCKVDDMELVRAAKEEPKAYDQLLNLIKKEYPREKRFANVARQITQFVNDIKAGDVILIPSKGTSTITIGEVESTDLMKFDCSIVRDKDCCWLKRKKVYWRKTIERNTADPYLFRLFYSQYTVTNADFYAPFIDRLLNSFFVKGDRAHLVLNVKQKDDISALEFSTLISNSLGLLKEFNCEANGGLDLDSIKLKVNVQSPGTIELFGAIGTIFALSAVLGLAGGKWNFKLLGLAEGNLETKGLLDKIYKFREQKHRHEMEKRQLETALQKLDVELPKELTNEPEDIALFKQEVAVTIDKPSSPPLLTEGKENN